MAKSFEADRKWLQRGAGEHYVGERFRGRRSVERDPRHIGRLLARHLGSTPEARVLDVPCGTGRLHAAAGAHARTYVGADRSPAMLADWAPPGPRALVLANVAALPFPDGSFDAIVCCRLLHHLDEQSELPAALRELVRVTKDVVVATFWDAASWPAWRRRRGWRRDETGRRAIGRARLSAAFARAGADVTEWEHSFRFVSQQAYLVARKRR